jgi:hypothetical protein
MPRWSARCSCTSWQHEALEHLLPQDVRRRQLLPLLLNAVGDRAHLLLELATQHDAVVDDGRDAVEQHPALLKSACAATAAQGRRSGTKNA